MSLDRPLRSVLIANRGEIACRVMRTLRRLGIRSVAVFSDADRDALHVKLADAAYAAGPAPAADSYLRQDVILDIARRAGVDGIHPGYGFLSENPQFASACESAGIKFIGPSSASIAAMGSKSAAKALMEVAKVPLIPGYHGDDQTDSTLVAEAERIGYPLLIKAAFGGGGKGMRVVTHTNEFMDALHSCRREAQASFGNTAVLLERYLTRPRHVEIQVFCDQHGNGVYLGERDCSIQRRHQKIIEEAPAPGLTPELRRAMGDAAVAAARAINYEGAGTIEFLLDRDGRFYFMEMNTRLQVEHPVTEYITGQDLVEWQIRVARGERLPLQQDEITLQGHAIEARICAESPAKGFMPSIGVIDHLATPAITPDVRIDTGIGQGSDISPYYDPMIAKLIVGGKTREEARLRMLEALAQFHIVGVDSNVNYLHRILSLDAFASADLSTHFLQTHDAALAPRADDHTLEHYRLAALAKCLMGASSRPDTPWQTAGGWQLNASALQRFRFETNAAPVCVDVTLRGDEFTVCCGGDTFTCIACREGQQLRVIDKESRIHDVLVRENQVILFKDGEPVVIRDYRPDFDGHRDNDSGHLNAPMPGRLVHVLVAAGDRVIAGQPLVIMEAMKMEHTLKAPFDGVIDAIHHAVGDAVREGTELVSLHPLSEE